MPADGNHPATHDFNERFADISASPPSVNRTDRLLISPWAFEDALDDVRRNPVEKASTALLIDIDLTAIGVAGYAPGCDTATMLDGLRTLLTRQLRQHDLLSRRGDRGFRILVLPLTETDGRQIGKRVSATVEGFIAEWRTHGVVICCAISQSMIGIPADAPHDRRNGAGTAR